MRAWLGYIFILLIGTCCASSPALAASVKKVHSTKATLVQTPAVRHNDRNQYCDQMEDTEVITANYTQHTAYEPVVLTLIGKFHPNINITAAARLSTGRDNARIQPFYKLILFPFHVFW
nr:hypothetical protein [Mucilaginibacter sp. L294]